MYFSLPASVHLSLYSFPQFSFLLHIRLSSVGTRHATDIIPETCHALVQLGPGVLPLLPRAAIALVVLIAFWSPEADVAASATPSDHATDRDPHFFKASAAGQLTSYGRGVLLAFIACTAFRLLIVLVSAVTLWMFSARPLGGIFEQSQPRQPRTSRRIARSSNPPRDPAQTLSPPHSGLSEENWFDWPWRDRSRARIQDAFELCMMRSNADHGRNHAWDAVHRTGELDGVSRPSVMVDRPNSASLNDLAATQSLSFHPYRREEQSRPKSPLASTPFQPRSPLALGQPSPGTTPSASSSFDDLFYTPAGGSTPAIEMNQYLSPKADPEDYGRPKGESRTSTGLLSVTPSPSGMRNRALSVDDGRVVGPSSECGASLSNTGPGRARSTSIGLSRESIEVLSIADPGTVRRAKSGTTLTGDGQSSLIEGGGVSCES